MTDRHMETLRQAIARLERQGFRDALRPQPGGQLAASGTPPLDPESLVVEEIVRFEGESDPEDQAVLFALRSRDGAVRGTFVANYGAQVDRDSVAVMRRLDASGRPRDSAS